MNRLAFVIGLALLAAGLCLGLSACAGDSSSGRGGTGGSTGTSGEGGRTSLEAQLTLNTHGEALGGFDVSIRFDPKELRMFDVYSQLPAPLKLHFDRTQFESGTLRLIAVAEPDRGQPNAVTSNEPLKVAKLYFNVVAYGRADIDPQKLTWEFLQPRVYRPGLDAVEMKATFEVTLKVMKLPQ